MRLLIMGPPGAGKGSQAVLIKQFYQIPHISTGDMFRKAILKNSTLGIHAKEFIDKGELVPDAITLTLVKERLQEEDCRNGFLLDGFPRTIAQAIAFDVFLKENNMKIDCVINLVVDDTILISRIAGRRICNKCGATYHTVNHRPKQIGICDQCGGPLYQRNDDNEETVRNRINVYQKQTKPLLEYYQQQGLVFNVDGVGNIDDIFCEVQIHLGGMDDIN